ncbi:Zinc Finger Fyve Domain-Containing Protein 16 [Manis pentadactyla]|nr:Zinc Finger Fyve Domain-Containing Protein 16 [Manis pentadactyla]
MARSPAHQIQASGWGSQAGSVVQWKGRGTLTPQKHRASDNTTNSWPLLKEPTRISSIEGFQTLSEKPPIWTVVTIVVKSTACHCCVFS